MLYSNMVTESYKSCNSVYFVVLCSVCGLIVPQEDLPFNDLGMCPDVVSDSRLFIIPVLLLLLLMLYTGV